MQIRATGGGEMVLDSKWHMERRDRGAGWWWLAA